MEEKFYPVTSYPSGDLARWRARLADPINWLGPAWAALCGAVASGAFGEPGREGWLQLALLILLTDVGWGVLWAALGLTDWATPLRDWRDWRSGEPLARPPYTLPGSPGDRASRWLGQLRAWWRGVFWPACGLSFSAGAIALLATAVLGMLLGTDLLLLSAAALAVMQLGLAWSGGRGEVAPAWDAVIVVGLPWLAGQVLFSGTLDLPSAGLALAFTLGWGAGERLPGIGAQLLAAVMLVALRQPLAAVGLLTLLAPQLTLLPWVRRGQPAAWYMRYARPWTMAAMMIAAWAL